ncbi:TetR family transcriptional regulator [Paenibacillus sp. LC231]|uniref:TetR/AcrR family transcriptional regulator n=1 Tax=Paenibacillus sp. LC231 TaxID=1120679 RepID=UPI0008DC9ECB|nr:TetR/AcrR family transcriptional regulator [Paenibacillus sp. LC231]OIA99576.1 TetR family transcriptional regulator [Paenibacillus sp. LC231]
MSKDESMDPDIGSRLPGGAALSWGLVKPPKRGPKREMSLTQIVQTAIDIADKEGLQAVSMNRIASALGFTAMSLYRYISSKDDLLLLMQDAVCDIPIPPEDFADWRENMRIYVKSTMQVFRDHPWYGDIPIMGIPITPNNLRFIDWGLRFMKDMPLNDYERMSLILLLSNYSRSSGMMQRDLDRAVQAGSTPEQFSGQDYTAALKQLVTPDRFPFLHPVVMSGVYTEENQEENPIGNDIDFGLERILDGIAHYLQAKTQPGQSDKS